MATPVQGAGYLRVIDRLQDASYALFQPVVNETFPATIAAGTQTIPISDPAVWVPTVCFYVGAQLVCGVTGANLEVVTVTAVNVGVSFSAVFANAHQQGEQILGATFPVRYPTDPLITQAEAIAYFSSAMSDYLEECPLVYEIATITVPPTAQSVALPSDCMWPARVAYQGYPLRETSQSSLDGMYFTWNEQGLSQPRVFYRDKLPIQNVGVWPRAGNNVPLEVVYAARTAQTLGWGDGLPIPDPFTIYPFYRTLSFFFSKDGEIRNPGLAKYFQSRYEFGVKVTNMILNVVNDSSNQ
jgi:hypothetical protein